MSDVITVSSRPGQLPDGLIARRVIILDRGRKRIIAVKHNIIILTP